MEKKKKINITDHNFILDVYRTGFNPTPAMCFSLYSASNLKKQKTFSPKQLLYCVYVHQCGLFVPSPDAHLYFIHELQSRSVLSIHIYGRLVRYDLTLSQYPVTFMLIAFLSSMTKQEIS